MYDPNCAPAKMCAKGPSLQSDTTLRRDLAGGWYIRSGCKSDGAAVCPQDIEINSSSGYDRAPRDFF